MSTEKIKKIKEIWNKYEEKIVLFLGILVVGIISFQLGTLQGQKWQQEPLIIEKISEAQIDDLQKVLGESVQKKAETETSNAEVSSLNSNSIEKCVFVGSKNSDKYHKKDCSYAARIKEENQVCFKDEEDAKNKGYVQAGCCFK